MQRSGEDLQLQTFGAGGVLTPLRLLPDFPLGILIASGWGSRVGVLCGGEGGSCHVPLRLRAKRASQRPVSAGFDVVGLELAYFRSPENPRTARLLACSAVAPFVCIQGNSAERQGT
uniref:Uncharacterized protein n=1 Tax=Knipowitschia caucasica TaxID=637954 RepID=A0AAV2MHD8_KNICA